MLLPKFLSRKISPEKSLDFLSQKSVVRPVSARGVRNIKIERHPVRSCSAPQMSRGPPQHLRQIHQQQQNATQVWCLIARKKIHSQKQEIVDKQKIKYKYKSKKNPWDVQFNYKKPCKKIAVIIWSKEMGFITIPSSRTVCKNLYQVFRICTRFFEGGPLTHGSWWGNIVNRKPPRGGGGLSIKFNKVKLNTNHSKIGKGSII